MQDGFGVHKNWGKWSTIVAVMSLGIISYETINYWLICYQWRFLKSLIDCKIHGIKEFEERESKNSLVVWYLV